MTEFTAEEIARATEAMAKPAPREALSFIAAGRLLVSLTADRRDLTVEELDGRRVIDPETGRQMLLAGGWPLFRAGMIDEFGCVTDAGRAALSESLP